MSRQITSWLPKMLALMLVAAALGVLGGLALGVHSRHFAPAVVPEPAIGAVPVIQIQPCKVGTLVGPGPSGSYVCKYDLPPVPKAGPTIAPASPKPTPHE